MYGDLYVFLGAGLQILVIDAGELELAFEALAIAVGACEDLINGLPECIRSPQLACAFDLPGFSSRRGAVNLKWEVTPLKIHVFLFFHPCFQ
ncbi:hypothetical protein EMIT0P201_50521 [Pseudomonas chlororaphis]